MTNIKDNFNNQTIESAKNDYDSEHKEAPGIIMKRRQFFTLPILATALLLNIPENYFAQTVTAKSQNTRDAQVAQHSQASAPLMLDWDDFITESSREVETFAQELSPAGQEFLLHKLASYAARLRLNSIPRAKVFPFANLKPQINFGLSYKGRPFVVVEWQMEAFAILPPHNHPNYSICTLGIEGEARIRNFEVVGVAPAFTSKESFKVQETHNEIIRPGRINIISATRDNIHTFQAGKAGARGIDIGILHGKDIGYSFLKLDEKTFNSETRVYDAGWIGESV